MSVYFITCRAQGICKIGVAQNPKARRSSLQTAFPSRLELEAVLPGDTNLERHLHQRFADQRLSGEWFALNDELEALISASASNVVQLFDKPQAPKPNTPSDEALAEESLRASREMLAEHERIFVGREFPDCAGVDNPRFHLPVATAGGQFNNRFCVRDGDGRLLCADMNLTWDQADRLCDVLDGVRQRSLALPVPNDSEEVAA